MVLSQPDISRLSKYQQSWAKNKEMRKKMNNKCFTICFKKQDLTILATAKTAYTPSFLGNFNK